MSTQSITAQNKASVGKTELAREYMYRYQSNYLSVFWLQYNSHIASPTDSLQQNIQRIIQELKIDTSKESNLKTNLSLFKEWLGTHQDWLLVIDNIENIEAIKAIIPTSHSGHVVITTREREAAKLGALIEINELTQEENELTQRLDQLINTALHSEKSEHIHLASIDNTIGSAKDNVIILEDASISPHHATIFHQSGQFYLIDLDSENGTFINTQRISPRTPMPLKKEDKIRIGNKWIAYDLDTTRVLAPMIEQEQYYVHPTQITLPLSQTVMEISPSQHLNPYTYLLMHKVWQTF